MLQLSQIKALLAEGLHVFCGTKGLAENGRPHPDYRAVWWQPEIYTGGPVDYTAPGQLMKAPPADETGEAWEPVDTPEFNAAEYNLHTDSPSYGGNFLFLNLVLPSTLPVGFKVVKLDNPVPPEEGHRSIPYYVVITSPAEVSDEQACEMAIDFVLGIQGTPFNGDNCHPVFVI